MSQQLQAVSTRGAKLLQFRDGMQPAAGRSMTIHNFTQLNVWQRAMDLVVDVYRITDAYPARERFVLASNTRRTAISIPSNIAEGFNIALGSEGELFTQLELGRRLGFTSDSRLTKYFDDLAEVGKMMRGLVTSLERGVVRR